MPFTAGGPLPIFQWPDLSVGELEEKKNCPTKRHSCLVSLAEHTPEERANGQPLGWQGWCLLEAPRENLFHAPLLSPTGPQQSLSFLGLQALAPVSAPIFPSPSFPFVNASFSVSFKTSHQIQGHIILCVLISILTIITSIKTLFPNEVTF